jgi:4-hydroxy-tetrahydrodipicolinate synthase
MSTNHSLSGVYAAALTPLLADQTLATEDESKLLDFLARRGCHGALLFGTTGEGPSFSGSEKIELWKTALNIRKSHPKFRLLAGTGTPSLDETIDLTRSAFDLGMDGVVVLPPYFYRNATEEGLFTWYSQVLLKGVPAGGFLFIYHIPQITGVSLSLDLFARLKDAYPERFAGIKDSSGNQEHSRQLGEKFGKDLCVFTGNDRLFSTALRNQASGCITYLANIRSQDLRLVWDAFERNEEDNEAQSRLDTARAIVDKYQPAAASLKALIARLCHFRRWAVRPPLVPISEESEKTLLDELIKAGIAAAR